MSNRVKRCVIALSVFPVLAGCFGPSEIWYRNGAKVNLASDDYTNCRVHAANTVPQDKRQRVSYRPAYIGNGICYGGYACTGLYGGTSTRVVTYDANDRLRRDVVRQCMQQKGYQDIDLVPCTPTITDEVRTRKTLPATQPSLNANSCVVPIGNQTWAVVTP